MELEELKTQVKSGTMPIGNGASFWGYISPQNDTDKNVTDWKIIIHAKDNNWEGVISSENPQQQLHTPGLSGEFNVKVIASGPKMPETTLTPQQGSQPDIGCNSNCYGMVGIVSSPDGTAANYWTVWDAFCQS